MSAENRTMIGRFPNRTLTEGPVSANIAASSTTELNSNLLTVCSLDLLKSKTGPNRLEHHTERYNSNNLVLRRGQTFQMYIELSRPFQPQKDKVQLELKLGPLAMISKGTLVMVPTVKEFTKGQWGAKIVEQNGNKIKLSVISPPNAPIGRYEITITTISPKGHSKTTRKPEDDIYMLFNPWCVDDAVYIDSEAERNEYVLNDIGKLYYGTETQIGSRNWNFGQFSEGILEACIFVLEKSRTLASGWGSSVNISRIMSAMVNSNDDDDGVLMGNWSGDYSDGTSPTAWTGSIDILRQYHKNGGSPVKYGQCWVFSGVTTTVLRCLGIPARSVTNFSSAHDTDVSMTIDVYMDENLKLIESLNSDSVWNFHVWNEAWMSRNDLQDGMGGWQVVDATPQETSQGMLRCGPAPVVAIRNGQVNLKYDLPFVFAEVKSDKAFWQRKADGTFTLIEFEKGVVGHCISTKAVGSDRREDITHLYKHPEGSEEERIAVETACRFGSKPDTYSGSKVKDVSVKVSLKEQESWRGKDAQLCINIQNECNEPRTLKLFFEVAVMYYTGVYKATVKNDNMTLKLKPKEVQNKDWTLKYEDYKGQLADQGALMLNLFGRVTESNQLLATQFNFRLRNPDIVVTPVGDAVVGKEMAVKITFTNPLQSVLNNVKFRIEGLGLLPTNEISHSDVAARATATLTQKFTPFLPGPRRLLVSMDSTQLKQVHGFADINVKK